MKIIKYLPLLLIMLFVFSASSLNAIETFSKEVKIENNVRSKAKTENVKLKKGFFKRIYRKISEKIRKVRLSTVRKVKRVFSKRKARKNRMRSKFKNRNRNLYNILIYSGLFLLVAALFSLLFIYSLITLKLLIILGIALIVATIVIGLIYFSRRYTIKPNYK